MTPLDAMKQALGHLKFNADATSKQVRDNLRTAITEMEKAEPVACMVLCGSVCATAKVDGEYYQIVWGDHHLATRYLYDHPTQSRDEWKEAVIDELVVCGIYSATHDSNPRKAIQDAIQWNVDTALDPLVSEAAQQLKTQGRNSIIEGCAKACEEVHSRYPTDIFPEGQSVTAQSAKMARITANNCALEMRALKGK